MKICSLCGKPKLLKEFWADKKSSDGRQSRCISCKKQEFRAWVVSNPEKNAEKRRRFAQRHPTYNSDWVRRNRLKRNIASANRRLAIREKLDLTVEDWATVCDQYGNVCLACGSPAITIDHVVPVSLRGPTSVANVQPLCKPCNSGKRDRIRDYRPNKIILLGVCIDTPRG